ncbi:MAG: sigma-70 family RNA polymerase sigma factor [Phycisphaerae bacterium]|nr:sigma-70 family RNA polymerase sigma factor [Phycisphaerae bacterium]
MPSIAADRAPMCADRSGPTAFPSLTVRQMEFRTERLGRIFALPADQVADLRQELALEIVRALPRFESSRASRTTFMKGVMNLWYRQKCRQLRREAAAQSRMMTLPAPGCEGADFADATLDGIAEVDARLDLAERLLTLPTQLFDLARELLDGRSIPEIAAERGVHRGTVHRMVMQLRAHLADLDPSVN